MPTAAKMARGQDAALWPWRTSGQRESHVPAGLSALFARKDHVPARLRLDFPADKAQELRLAPTAYLSRKNRFFAAR